MVKHLSNKKQGVVNLNNARPGVNEHERPVVPPQKKVPNTRRQKDQNKNSQQSMPTVNKTETIKPIGNVTDFKDKSRKFIPRDKNGNLLISRRNLIFGAIGAGALVVAGTGIKFATDSIRKGGNAENTLTVSKSSVINSDTLNENPEGFLNIENEIILPYGTLAWANSSNVIACLIPTEQAKPLTMVDLININNGLQINILEGSINQKEGFEIYDVRANDDGIIWTEVNILQGEWRIYASSFSSNFNTKPILIDKGGKDWETPTIAVSGENAYWQVLPNINSNKKNMLSSLKKVSFNSLSKDQDKTTSAVNSDSDIKDNPNTIYTSSGRMSTPVYPYDGGVVITPRANINTINYQLTYINENGEDLDSVLLPQNMKPLEAGYGKTGFNFSFDAIYNYGEGISNLGTYTPMVKNKDNYENLKWLNFSRNPSAPPAWCKNYFVIRSTMAICVCDLNTQQYCVLDRPNASDDYGDYLASSDLCDKIVTYANIYNQPVSGEETKYCSLRIWS